MGLRRIAVALLVAALAAPPVLAEGQPVQLLPRKTQEAKSSLFSRAVRLFGGESDAALADISQPEAVQPGSASDEGAESARRKAVQAAPRIPALPRARPAGEVEIADEMRVGDAAVLPDDATESATAEITATPDGIDVSAEEDMLSPAVEEAGGNADVAEISAPLAWPAPSGESVSDPATDGETVPAEDEMPAAGELSAEATAVASAGTPEIAPVIEEPAIEEVAIEGPASAEAGREAPASEVGEDAAALDAALAAVMPVPEEVVAAATASGAAPGAATVAPASSAPPASERAAASIAGPETTAPAVAEAPAVLPDPYEIYLTADTLAPAGRAGARKAVRVIDLSDGDMADEAVPPAGRVQLARPLDPLEEAKLAAVRKLAMGKAFNVSTEAFFRPAGRERSGAEPRGIFVPFYEPTHDEIVVDDAVTGSVAAPAEGGEAAEEGGKEEPRFEPLAVPARPGSREPRDLVQRLQSLQDQIAQGSTEAFNAQRALLEEIGSRFEAAPAETWQDRRNAEALVTYVLSGGRPNLLAALLVSEPLPALDEQLMRGALAYVEGRAAEARSLLDKIDARDFAGSMGSQVAIAQAALDLPENPKAAAAHLDMARLLSPGTLAEEAAIRREIIVLAQIEDTDRFQLLSRQYMQRFRHSVYAGNFRQRFAAALTRMTFMEDPKQLPRLDEILAEMEPDARLELYLVIARALVVQAKSEPAKLAAQRALDLSEPGRPEAERALLYRAAATVATENGLQAGLTDLSAVDTSLLPQADLELYNMVSATAELIRTAATALPAAKAAVPSAPKAASDGEKSEPAADEPSQVMARAEGALKLADTLLGEAQ
ncbi:hypothetical protein CLD20_00655 [Afifella sp. IM 167]|nr:hypothetical protein [Afifella sp. IM 167]